MPASNIYTLGFAVQTAKGTPAASPTYLTRVNSADLAPAPSRERIEETNASRDGGDRYTTIIEVSGGAEFVLRRAMAGIILYGIYGAKTSVGTGTTSPTAPYTHTFTPGDDQPWLTIWRSLGNALYEVFEDCKIVAATFSGEAGQNVMTSITIMGLKPRRETAAPTGGMLDTSVPFRVPGVAYTIDGGANNAVRQFSVEINADQNAIQTTEIYNTFLEPGLRTIEVSYTEVFQNLERYNKTIYGGPAGTEPSEGIYHGGWQAQFGDMAAGPGFSLNVPNLAFMTAPLEPDPGGDPLEMEVTGEADTPATGSITTATLVNDVASY